MKTSQFFLSVACGAATLALTLCPKAQAQNNNDNPAAFMAFKLTNNRNIFDPERRPIFVPNNTPPQPQKWRDRRPRENSITLTGVMVADGKKLAFFAGTRPEYNKVIGLNDKIADFTIKEITSSEVKFELSGKPIDPIPPGQKLPLNGSAAAKEEATMPGPDEAPPDVASNDGGNNGNGDNPGPPPSGGDNPGPPPTAANPPPSNNNPAAANDVLRRMMEKRARGE